MAAFAGTLLVALYCTGLTGPVQATVGVLVTGFVLGRSCARLTGNLLADERIWGGRK